MNRKRNDPSWCCDQIEEKIKDYKISLTETDNEEVRRQLEIIIDDLETILYGSLTINGCNFCNDLRNIEPAKYIGGGDEKFQEWINRAKKNKKFVLLNGDELTIVDECPVCGRKFIEEDYDNFD